MIPVGIQRDIGIIGGGAVLAMAPLFLDDYWIGLLTQALIYGAVAAGLDLLIGFGGLASLGHAAFFGMSAYGTAILTTQGDFDPVVAALIAILGTAVVAAIVAPFFTRLWGIGFITVTLAFGQVVWGLAVRGGERTGGENGIVGIPRPNFIGDLLSTDAGFYLATVVLVAGVLLVVSRIAHSPFGLSLLGIRDGEHRMTALGYRVNARRSVVFTIAATIAAVLGAWFVFFNHFIGPSTLHWKQSAGFLLAVVIGGRASIWGPFLAGVFLTILETVLTGETTVWPMVLGALYIVAVLVIPDGIASIGSQLRSLASLRSRETP
jgi:branched-chain amino acid transport system permease protein